MKRKPERELTEEFGIIDLAHFLKRSAPVILLFLFSTTFFTVWQHKRSPSYTAHAILTMETAKSDPMQAVAHKIAGLTSGAQDESEKMTDKYLILFTSGIFLEDVARGMIASGKVQEFLSLLPGNKNHQKISVQELSEEIIILMNFEKFAPDTIRISASLPNKENAVLVMNILLEAFHSAVIERESKDISSAKKFLEEQLGEVESRLSDIDLKVLSFQRNSFAQKRKSKISNNEPIGPITNLERALVDLRLELHETESLMRQFSATGVPSKYTPIDKYGAASSYENLVRRRDQLNIKISSNQKVLAELFEAEKSRPQGEREIEDLYKRKELEYRLFSDLKKEIMTLDIQKISTQNKIKVLERALLSATHASLSLNSAIAKRGVFAMVIACLTVFLWEMFHPVIRGRKDLSEFRVSYLGSLPRIDQNRRRGFRRFFTSSKLRKDNLHVMDIEPDSYYDMVFKNIRARIMNFRLESGHMPKVISVMSPSSGEGKTSVSCNLAKSIAMSGKRVLLVDADLRKRSMSLALKFQSDIGLSEYLAKPNVKHEKPVVKNLSKFLDILPAGQYSPYCSELISGKHFADLIDAMREFYDFIILDTPPALPFSEIIPIAKSSDMIVAPFLANQTKLEAVDQMLEKIQFSVNTPIGYVLNMTDDRQTVWYYPQKVSSHLPAA